MPLALEPGKTFEVVLPSDRDKPESERPTFVFRHLSCREYKAVAHEVDSDSGTTLDGTIATLKRMLVSWRNMGDAKCPDDLDAVVAPAECMLLMNLALAGGNVTVSEAKK